MWINTFLPEKDGREREKASPLSPEKKMKRLGKGKGKVPPAAAAGGNDGKQDRDREEREKGEGGGRGILFREAKDLHPESLFSADPRPAGRSPSGLFFAFASFFFFLSFSLFLRKFSKLRTLRPFSGGKESFEEKLFPVISLKKRKMSVCYTYTGISICRKERFFPRWNGIWEGDCGGKGVREQ